MLNDTSVKTENKSNDHKLISTQSYNEEKTSYLEDTGSLSIFFYINTKQSNSCIFKRSTLMMDYTSVVLEVSYHFERLHEFDSTNHYWIYEVKISKTQREKQT